MFFWTILCVLFIFRLWISCFGGIHPDEAYYWYWSFSPQWGYFDHPPMVGWLIYISRHFVEFIIPDMLWERDPRFYSQLGLRLVPYLVSSVFAPFMLGKIIEMIQQKPLRVLQMWVLVTSPLFLFGPLVITPDVPLFFFWTLSLYIGLQFLVEKGPSKTWPQETPFRPTRAIWMGVALGLCFYSKYTAVLACFIYAVSISGLANGIVSALALFVVLIPQLLWNFDVGIKEGAGLFFQMQNGLGGTLQIRPVYKWAGDLWLTQLVFWGPLMFLLSLLLPFRRLRKLFSLQRHSYFTGTLAVWAFTPLFFFSLTTLQRRAEGNWPLIGAVAAFAMVLSRLQRRSIWLTWLIIFNLLSLAGGYVVFIHGQSIASLAGKISPDFERMLKKPSRLEEFSDWKNFHELVFESVRMDNDPILVRSYQLLSSLLFEDHASVDEEKLGNRLKIWAAHSRKSQFHIDPAYRSPDSNGAYWIVTRLPNVENDIPSNCRLANNIEKGSSGQYLYGIYKCKANPVVE